MKLVSYLFISYMVIINMMELNFNAIAGWLVALLLFIALNADTMPENFDDNEPPHAAG